MAPPLALSNPIRAALQRGVVIPAHPLALTARHRLDEQRQRALSRYYIAAGAGGLAVGVHTTQFAIRDPKVGLFVPVLSLAAEEMNRADAGRSVPLIRIGGICGPTEQAVKEAAVLRELGYHAALVSLAAFAQESNLKRLAHVRTVAREIPVVGFYLQSAVGGPALPYSFWRKLAELDNVLAIKIAPFNRYQTLDVVRAITEAGRNELALFTGNDDNIVMDLITPYRFTVRGVPRERRIVGGLLGHWAVWTRKAVELLATCHAAVAAGTGATEALLRRSVEVTDCNAAFFDVANHFAGCIAGLHEVLRRQGLLKGIWCLNPKEKLSPGQAAEISRVHAAYPHLNDDSFVRERLDGWLA